MRHNCILDAQLCSGGQNVAATGCDVVGLGVAGLGVDAAILKYYLILPSKFLPITRITFIDILKLSLVLVGVISLSLFKNIIVWFL